jgi:hypothetical protein
LAAAIDAKTDSLAAIERAEIALSRLAAAQAGEAPLIAELANLDATEASAMATWARSGAGDAPLSDVGKRESINKRLTDSRAKGAAATRAEGGLRDEIGRERAKIGLIDRAITEAVAEAVSEEAIDLIPDFLAANRAASVKADRILAAREFIGDMARALPEGKGVEIFNTLERLNARLDGTFTRVAPEELAAQSRGEWSALIGRLHSDATAILEA